MWPSVVHGMIDIDDHVDDSINENNYFIFCRAVLVVFGNPDILIGDSDWRSLIMDCYNNGTYYGCDLPAGYKPIDNIGTVA